MAGRTIPINSWTDFKALFQAKELTPVLKWELNTEDFYVIWFNDGLDTYENTIDHSQVSADRTDFENNFKTVANIVDRIRVDANLVFEDNSLVTIGDFKKQLWTGKLFEVSTINTKQNDEEILFLIKVDADYNLHADGLVTSELGTEAYIYEAPTVSANGSAVTPVASNRATTETFNSLVYSEPTVTAEGTLIRSLLFPGSNQAAAAGSEPGTILKHGTDYLIKTVSRGNNNDILSHIFMYERDKNV